MLRKKPKLESTLGDPIKYVEKMGGMNSPTGMASYLSTLAMGHPSQVKMFRDPTWTVIKSLENYTPYETFGAYTEKKKIMQRILDQDVINAGKSLPSELKEVTGDGDHITNYKRMLKWKKAIKNGMKAEVIMDIKPWNIRNAEIMNNIGVNVKHLGTTEDYHFGTITDSNEGARMFTLFREPANKDALKIVGVSQDPSIVKYYFFTTNYSNYVEYANKLYDELIERAIDFADQKERLNKNKENSNMLVI